MTVKLSILKTHMTDGQWAHAGSVLDIASVRAGELVRNGLAEPASEAPEPDAKEAPAPSNKKKPGPDNKAAGG